MDAWIVLDSYDAPTSSTSSVVPGHLKEVSSSEPDQDQPTSTTVNEGDEKMMEIRKSPPSSCDEVCIPTSSTNENKKWERSSNSSIRLSHREEMKKSSDVSSNYEKFMRIQKSYPNILNQGIMSMTKDLMNAGAFGLECFRAISNQGRQEQDDLEAGIFLKPQDTRFMKSGYEWVSEFGFLVFFWKEWFFLKYLKNVRFEIFFFEKIDKKKFWRAKGDTVKWGRYE